MKLNAQDINCYLRATDEWRSFKASEHTELLIKKLAEILDQLEPQGIDNYHLVFVSAPRPTFRQYFKHHVDEPYKKASKKETDHAKKNYIEEYPSLHTWFKLGIKHFLRKGGEEFYALFINSHVLFTINDSNSRGELDGSDVLNWAIEEAQKVVDAVRAGTYKEILDSIPYCYRQGKIKRSEYWKLFPSHKRAFLSNYNQHEIKAFRKNFDPKQLNVSFLPDMTARRYYEACAVIYRALERNRKCSPYRFTESDAEKAHYNEYSQTPKEMYYANADGRDDGLVNVPLDDANAFEDWKQYKSPYYEFNGSHPWEIIPSFSISCSMHLYPVKTDKGYYFDVSGDSAGRAPETIIAANALVHAGLPVVVSNYQEIISRIDGEDDLKVYPINKLAFEENIIHLPKGPKGAALAEKTVWDTYDFKVKNV